MTRSYSGNNRSQNDNTRAIWPKHACIWERSACGSLKCYHGEAANVMRLVWRYSR